MKGTTNLIGTDLEEIVTKDKMSVYRYTLRSYNVEKIQDYVYKSDYECTYDCTCIIECTCEDDCICKYYYECTCGYAYTDKCTCELKCSCNWVDFYEEMKYSPLYDDWDGDNVTCTHSATEYIGVETYYIFELGNNKRAYVYFSEATDIKPILTTSDEHLQIRFENKTVEN